MNFLNFLQTGGFPLETDTLEKMQAAYKIFNSLGSISGEHTIISGCDVAGLTTSDGVVFIAGELYKFVGGNTQGTVRVLETFTQKVWENGDQNDWHVERYVTFASGVGSIPWANFSKPATTKSLTERVNELERKNAVFQDGGAMVFWNKPLNLIPDGWQEVVAWRGRMPVGMNTADSSFNTLGEQGGSKTANINVNIPNPWNSFGVGGTAGSGDAGKLIVASGQNEDSEYFESLRKANSAPTSNLDTSFNVMNPYRVVIFIEYIQE